jgi:hypothetical protein
MLGFESSRAYLAALDHAFRVDFLQANLVIPLPVEPEDAPGLPAHGPDAPFGRVIYADLWPGITLVYERTAAGSAASLNYLAPNADPGQIRLRYSAPVEVQPDGSLAILFEQGLLIELAPAAWQEIDGEIVPVAAAYVVSNGKSGQEVSFALSEYDPDYPLVIGPAAYLLQTTTP